MFTEIPVFENIQNFTILACKVTANSSCILAPKSNVPYSLHEGQTEGTLTGTAIPIKVENDHVKGGFQSSNLASNVKITNEYTKF